MSKILPLTSEWGIRLPHSKIIERFIPSEICEQARHLSIDLSSEIDGCIRAISVGDDIYMGGIDLNREGLLLNPTSHLFPYVRFVKIGEISQNIGYLPLPEHGGGGGIVYPSPVFEAEMAMGVWGASVKNFHASPPVPSPATRLSPALSWDSILHPAHYRPRWYIAYLVLS